MTVQDLNADMDEFASEDIATTILEEKLEAPVQREAGDSLLVQCNVENKKNEEENEEDFDVSDLLQENEEEEKECDSGDGSVESKYSWLMLLNVYIGLIVTYGLSSTMGIFHVIFLNEFQETNAMTSWIGSVNSATTMFAAWLCSLFLRYFSPRVATILGILMCTVGALTSSFATSIGQLIFTFGLVTGCGVGFTYLALGECMNLWFDRHLPLAAGIGSSALGMTSFLYAPIIRALTNSYGWRGALIILSAIVFQYVVLACFTNPPRAKQTTTKPKLKLKDAFRTSLFKNKAFLWFLFAEFCFHAGVNMVQVHLENFVKSYEFGTSYEHWAIPLYGISNALGRLFFGLIGNLPRVDAQTMMIVFVSLGGGILLALPWMPHGAGLLTGSALYGFVMGVVGYSTYIVVVNYFDKDYMASAFGYVCLSNAFGYIGGAPLAGFLYDVTSNYDCSMYVGAALHTLPWLPLIVTSFKRPMTSLDLNAGSRS